MRVTGWTVPELRATPARVVRAHFARIFAGLLWDPALASAAAVPVAPRAAFGDPGAWGAAHAAKAQAVDLVAQMRAVLWPEDDDG
jgi:hypothetical protein